MVEVWKLHTSILDEIGSVQQGKGGDIFEVWVLIRELPGIHHSLLKLKK